MHRTHQVRRQPIPSPFVVHHIVNNRVCECRPVCARRDGIYYLLFPRIPAPDAFLAIAYPESSVPVGKTKQAIVVSLYIPVARIGYMNTLTRSWIVTVHSVCP